MFANEITTIERPGLDWSAAACRVEGVSLTGLFFSEQIDDIAWAKTICSSCELIGPCLDGAIARREPWGVWGGQLFANGKILAQKRKRGRPPKIRPQVTEVPAVAQQAQSA
jgi:WhiB family redox-sensing transcriptional regulator